MGNLEIDTYCFTDAENYHQKSLDLKKKYFGEDDIEVAKEYYSLGLIQATSGDNEKALLFYEKALEIYKKKHIEDGDDISQLYRNIGMAKGGLGNCEESIILLYKHYEQITKLRGEINPSVAQALVNFGRIYGYSNKPKEALEAYTHALEIYKKILPNGHPNIIPVWAGMADVYYFDNHKDKALECLERCIDLIRQYCRDNDDLVKLFNSNSFVFCYMYTISEIYMDKKDYENAKKYLLLCIEGYEKLLPRNNHKLEIQWIKWNYFIQKKLPYKDTLESYHERIKALEEFAYQNPELALFKRQLGLIYFYEGHYAESLNVLDKAINTINEKFPLIVNQVGKCSLVAFEFAQCLYQKGQLKLKLGDDLESKRCFLESLEIQQKLFNQDHPFIQDVKDYLDQLNKK